MQKTKLIDLLSQLNPVEIEKFGDYVHSPIANKRAKIVRLCDFLLPFAPYFDHANLTKSNATKAVFDKKTASNTAFNNIISDTLQLLYDFLAYQKYKSNTLFQQDALLKDLIQRNAKVHAERNIRKFKNELDEQTLRDMNHYQQQFLFFEKLNQLYLRKSRREYDENLQEMSHHFDTYYLLQNIKMACEMASRNVIMQGQYDYTFFEKCYAFFQKEKQIDSLPSIQIYHRAFLLMTDEAHAQHYIELRTLLQQHSPLLAAEELNNIYGYILNYCIRQINSGKTDFYAEIFEWYKILLRDEILFEQKQLSEKNFMNIVTVSLRSHAYEWTEKFITDYKDYLKKDVRENAVSFNLAALFYAKKDYNRALLQLIDVNFTDSFYHLGSNMIQLKCYFHLQETEAYLALVQALRQYIQRNKQLSSFHKSASLNFLKLAKQIYQLHSTKDLIPTHVWKKKHLNQQQILQQTQPISDKEWLREVLEIM